MLFSRRGSLVNWETIFDEIFAKFSARCALRGKADVRVSETEHRFMNSFGVVCVCVCSVKFTKGINARKWESELLKIGK